MDAQEQEVVVEEEEWQQDQEIFWFVHHKRILEVVVHCLHLILLHMEILRAVIQFVTILLIQTLI